MQIIFPNGAPLPLLLGAAAIFAYFCGCFNGAVIVSKYILRNDVRNHGSGNAGLTNFFRTFGGPLTFVVILCDVLKAVVALLVSQWLMFSGYTIFISAAFAGSWDHKVTSCPLSQSTMLRAVPQPPLPTTTAFMLSS